MKTCSIPYLSITNHCSCHIRYKLDHPKITKQELKVIKVVVTYFKFLVLNLTTYYNKNNYILKKKKEKLTLTKFTRNASITYVWFI